MHTEISIDVSTGERTEREMTPEEVAQFVDYVPPVPQSATRARAKIALVRAGKYADVNDYVASSNNLELQIWWNEAADFERNHPYVLGVAAQLGWTDTQLDHLFRLAATVE